MSRQWSPVLLHVRVERLRERVLVEGSQDGAVRIHAHLGRLPSVAVVRELLVVLQGVGDGGHLEAVVLVIDVLLAQGVLRCGGQVAHGLVDIRHEVHPSDETWVGRSARELRELCFRETCVEGFVLRPISPRFAPHVHVVPGVHALLGVQPVVLLVAQELLPTYRAATGRHVHPTVRGVIATSHLLDQNVLRPRGERSRATGCGHHGSPWDFVEVGILGSLQQSQLRPFLRRHRTGLGVGLVTQPRAVVNHLLAVVGRGRHGAHSTSVTHALECEPVHVFTGSTAPSAGRDGVGEQIVVVQRTSSAVHLCVLSRVVAYPLCHPDLVAVRSRLRDHRRADQILEVCVEHAVGPLFEVRRKRPTNVGEVPSRVAPHLRHHVIEQVATLSVCQLRSVRGIRLMPGVLGTERLFGSQKVLRTEVEAVVRVHQHPFFFRFRSRSLLFMSDL